jgi:hypothetical protein
MTSLALGAIGPARCLDVIRGVTSWSIEERDAWADIPGEWVLDGELDADEIHLVGAALAWAALIEIDRPRVRAGFLSSLSIMGGGGMLPTRVLELVTSGIADPHPVEVEGLDYLTAMLRGQRVGPSGPGCGRTVGPAHCVDLLRGLSSEAREDRLDWGPTAGEWLARGDMDAFEASTAAAALLRAAVVEHGGHGVHVGLLGSLAALGRARVVPGHVLRELRSALPREDLDPAEREAYRTLLDAATPHRTWHTPDRRGG